MNDDKITPNDDDFKVEITDDMFDKLNNTASIPTIEKPIAEENLLKAPLINSDKTSAQRNYTKDNSDKRKTNEHKKRDKVKAIKNKRVFRLVWFSMIIMVSLSLANYLIIGSNDFFAVGRLNTTVDIEIPDDVTVDELADLLYENNLINSTDFFKLYFSITSDLDEIRTGDHADVETNQDYEGLINTLGQSEPKEVVTITFPEGLTIVEVADLLEEYGVADKDEILEAANSGEFDNYDMIELIENDDEKYYVLEGYLFPDQYNFYTNEDIDSVLGKLLYNFQTKITVEIMAQIEESGYTLDEIIILASIIQAEAANEDDMAKISAVLHNRLESGASQDIYTLGLDSTYFYPYNNSSAAPAGYVSDYETNTQSGLPEGAICNPGIAAIEAALNPDSDYSTMYYFCHDSEGNAYYAETYSGHEANLIKAGIS